MMTKAETIEKIRAASERVLKKQDVAAGTINAIDVVIKKLTALRDDVAVDGDVDWEDLTVLGECAKIMDTIWYGYPMVPAAEDVAKAAGRVVAVAGFAEYAADELEKAAAEPFEKRVVRISALKMAVDVWEKDEKAGTVPILEGGAIIHVLKEAGAKAALAKAAAAAPAPAAKKTADERLEAVAKAAVKTDEPAADKGAAPAAAPAAVTWGGDLNREIRNGSPAKSADVKNGK